MLPRVGLDLGGGVLLSDCGSPVVQFCLSPKECCFYGIKNVHLTNWKTIEQQYVCLDK